MSPGKSAHIQTHSTVSSSWIAPVWESWLFPGRMLAFPHTRPKPQPELNQHGPHSPERLLHSALKQHLYGSAMPLVPLARQTGRNTLLGTFSAFSSCVREQQWELSLAKGATCSTWKHQAWKFCADHSLTALFQNAHHLMWRDGQIRGAPLYPVRPPGVDVPTLAVCLRENKHTGKVKAQPENAEWCTLCVTLSIYSLTQIRPLPHNLSDDPIPAGSEENVKIHVSTSTRTPRPQAPAAEEKLDPRCPEVDGTRWRRWWWRCLLSLL